MLASGPLVGGPRAEAAVEDLVGAVGRVPEVMAFRCSVCELEFTTKTGLGVHRTKKHPVEVNEEIAPATSKKKWSKEDDYLLARKEAQLVIDGSSHINEELSQAFPGRTVNAIKSRRRSQFHQESVLECVEEIRQSSQNQREEVNQATLAVDDEGAESEEEESGELKRWTVKEENILAKREAELTMTGCRHLNQALLGVLPRRSLDAIKGKRRYGSYQERVTRFLTELRTRKEVPQPTTVCVESGSREGSQSREQRPNLRRNPRRQVRRDGDGVDEDRETARLPTGILNFLEEPANDDLSTGGSLLEEEGQDIVNSYRINDDLGVVVALLEDEDAIEMERQNVEEQRMEICLPAGNVGSQGANETIKEELRRSIRLDAPPTHQSARLFAITRDHLRGKEVTARLNEYLDDVFPQTKKERRRPNQQEAVGPRNRRKDRRAEYARIQDLYQKNRGRCAEEIFGIGARRNPFTVQQFEEEWKPVFGHDGGNRGRTVVEKPEAKKQIWSPIMHQELSNSRMTKVTAPGPDGITVDQLKAVPAITLRTLLNLILSIGTLPPRMNSSRTIFVPKIEDPVTPMDYRPLSITSVLTRQLHKILAGRLDYHLDWDERQRGFIHADGCAENILLVSTIIRDAHEKKKELHIMSMDIKKAFDSVTYGGIQDDLCRMGCPEEFLKYMDGAQDTATTSIEIEGEHSGDISIRRGVRQGDPLSPKIFSAVIDHLMRRFPRNIGYNLDGVTVNCGAFADDLLLFSSTVEGMKYLIKIAEEELTPKGLQFHPGKCTSISLVPDGKRKKMKVISTPIFKVAGELVPVTTVDGSFKYLGIRMTPTGVILYDNKHLENNLARLKAAPLKPQQRLCLLRDHLMPKYYHQLVFANLGAGKLNVMDMEIRKAVRGWLCLPHDVPTAFFHAAGRDGGLGIPALRWMIPRLTSDRLKALKTSEIEIFQAMARNPTFTKQETKAELLLKDQGRTYNTKSDQQKRWATLLYSTVDGKGLREASAVPAANHWLREGTRLISGRDFLQAVKLRIGALPTRARTTRGRTEDTKCRAGCRAKETIQHLLQCCPRTHGTRVKRHDGVVKLLKSQLERRGHDVTLEPHFRTEEGLRKPDLMVVKGDITSIIDVQVTQDDKPLEELHRRKKNYYANNQSLMEQARERSGRMNISFASFTITWRGVVCKSSAEFVQGLGLSKNDIKMLAVRTIQGSLHQWGTFNRMTEREAHPTGVG